MYPTMLEFRVAVKRSFEMSVTRPCILPLVVTRGTDQDALSSEFSLRDDVGVMRNYGGVCT